MSQVISQVAERPRPVWSGRETTGRFTMRVEDRIDLTEIMDVDGEAFCA